MEYQRVDQEEADSRSSQSRVCVCVCVCVCVRWAGWGVICGGGLS